MRHTGAKTTAANTKNAPAKRLHLRVKRMRQQQTNPPNTLPANQRQTVAKPRPILLHRQLPANRLPIPQANPMPNRSQTNRKAGKSSHNTPACRRSPKTIPNLKNENNGNLLLNYLYYGHQITGCPQCSMPC